MREVVFYEKGGIRKSALTSSIAAAIVGTDKRVMQIGCDPRADPTLSLRTGQKLTPVMGVLQAYGELCPGLDVISIKGYRGVACVETGGPMPGSSCASRGTIRTFDTLNDSNAFRIYAPEYVFFDVLDGVICDGFSVPIRRGHADKAVVMTSGEEVALYVAANIKKALDGFQERGYAKLRGIIPSCRDVLDEVTTVEGFVQRIGAEIIGIVPRDLDIQRAKEQSMTVAQMDSELSVSQAIIDVAKYIMVPVEEQKEGAI